MEWQWGDSSIVILIAIQEIQNSHLYSIDISDSHNIGSSVKNQFSKLTNKWALFKGNVVVNYIENIGKDIDLVLFDTSHFVPGEILDFLMILPFLREP